MAQTATCTTVTVTRETVPIAVGVRFQWGAVGLPPITFAIMSSRNNLVLLGMATIKELGIVLYFLALQQLRPRALPVKTGVETPAIPLRGV